MDVTEEILHQHGEQRRMFALLDEFPKDDVDGLAAIWQRLVIFLETHAEGEERFFYPELLKLGTGYADADSVEEEVEDAVKDPNEIHDAGPKASGLEGDDSPRWESGPQPPDRQRRPHGRGGAAGPPRLPPAREPRPAPRDRGEVRALRG